MKCTVVPRPGFLQANGALEVHSEHIQDPSLKECWIQKGPHGSSGPVVRNQEGTSPQSYQIRVWGLVSLLLLSTLKELIRPLLGHEAQVQRETCTMKG